MKSARRHESLIPLSREHHYALMLCLRIHRGLVPHADDPAWLRSKAEDVVRFLASDLLPHFQAEEEILFPAMQRFSGAPELMQELLAQHRELERLVEQLRQREGVLSPELLKQFADLLEAHIRREERALFPLFEQQATPEVARQIGQGITQLIGQAAQPRHPELLK